MKIFDRLFQASDNYLKQCKWTDMALLKFCLCAIGVTVGISIPPKNKRAAFIAAGIVFVSTYIPLMAKFLPILGDSLKEKPDD